MKYRSIFFSFVVLFGFSASAQIKKHGLHAAAFNDITIDGELHQRVLQNFKRLESDVYAPEHVFPKAGPIVSPGWPGDYEGRIILALTLQAQASRNEPKYLKEILDRIPASLNAMGYLGPVMKDSILEQQLSGHGWFLRGLCQYYEWKKDPKIEVYIKNVINNLALPTRCSHNSYPIDPKSRVKEEGAPSGNTLSSIGKWKLSTDIGCNFIFMDGLVHAYKLFPSADLKALIKEMTMRFFDMDLHEIHAQTHATLTALRAVLDFYEITGEADLLAEAEKRFQLYQSTATTENYENFNWFQEPKWTEPCGIVDAYLLAVKFWKLNKNPAYLEAAHRIYYNALCHTQRANGGFGLDNCVGPIDSSLSVYLDEAPWCCTMRGGEGLAKAVQFGYFANKQKIVVPFFNKGTLRTAINGKTVSLQQETDYPFAGKTSFKVAKSELKQPITFEFFLPEWAKKPAISINGKPVNYKVKNGFVSFTTKIDKDISIDYQFDMDAGIRKQSNLAYNRAGFYKLESGPLVLGYEGKAVITISEGAQIERVSNGEWKIKGSPHSVTPIFHVLDPQVNKEQGYAKQILFKKEQ